MAKVILNHDVSWKVWDNCLYGTIFYGKIYHKQTADCVSLYNLSVKTDVTKIKTCFRDFF